MQTNQQTDTLDFSEVCNGTGTIELGGISNDYIGRSKGFALDFAGHFLLCFFFGEKRIFEQDNAQKQPHLAILRNHKIEPKHGHLSLCPGCWLGTPGGPGGKGTLGVPLSAKGQTGT